MTVIERLRLGLHGGLGMGLSFILGCFAILIFLMCDLKPGIEYTSEGSGNSVLTKASSNGGGKDKDEENRLVVPNIFICPATPTNILQENTHSPRRRRARNGLDLALPWKQVNSRETTVGRDPEGTVMLLTLNNSPFPRRDLPDSPPECNYEEIIESDV